MISFRNRETANLALDYNLAINSVNCSTSLYVPRPPQCFQCQDWGHRATDCKAEDVQCGKCTQNHETKAHECKHSPKHTNGEQCIKEEPQCVNCSGTHNSWSRLCPKATQAFHAQANCPKFATECFLDYTPATFEDIRPTTERSCQ